MQFASRVCFVLLSFPVTQIVFGQTLGEQYELYLRGDCAAMGFARDSQNRVQPGQAGPNLTAYCRGFPPNTPPDQRPTFGTPAGALATGSGRENGADAAASRRDEAQTDSTETEGAVGWFTSVDYRNLQQDVTQYESGRRTESIALTAGGDRRIGKSVLLGAAVRAEANSGDFTSDDFADGGDFRSHGFGAVLFGSWFNDAGLFVDLSASTMAHRADSHRLVARPVYYSDTGDLAGFDPPPATVDADIEMQEEDIELTGGYDLSLARWTIGPRVGSIYRHTEINPYIESGATPMSLAFDELTNETLRSVVGLQASGAFTWNRSVLVPQLNVSWEHEYRSDQQAVTARFAEDFRADASRLRFLNQPPDRDTYTARLSLSATFANGIAAFVSAEKLFAHDYQDQFSASAGIRWQN